MFNNKEKVLSNILDDVFAAGNNQIDEARKKQISDFIITSINRDTPSDHLVINANLSEKDEGIILYILTTLRLIKMDINSNEIKSHSFPLNTLIGIDRKLTIDNRFEFSIFLKNGACGLSYSPEDKNITVFFQKIEQHLN